MIQEPTQPKLKLNKKRDFGDLFNDTFLFLKYNFKTLTLGILYYIVPLAILQGIVTGMLQYNIFTAVQNPRSLGAFSQISTSPMLTIMNYLFLFLIFSVLSSFVYTCMIHYQKYQTNLNLSDISKEMLSYVPKVLLSNVLIILLVIIGFIFLVIPGIYLMVCFSFVAPIIIFKKESIGSAISSCFSLIKGNWWFTFGILLLIGIIAGTLGAIFQLPTTIYGVLHFVVAGSETSSSINPILLILFTTISAIGNVFVQVLPTIAIGLNYYNLTEQKESSSLLEELDTVGNDE